MKYEMGSVSLELGSIPWHPLAIITDNTRVMPVAFAEIASGCHHGEEFALPDSAIFVEAFRVDESGGTSTVPLRRTAS